MSFTAEELEVLAAWSILKLLDVGIIAGLHQFAILDSTSANSHLEPKLVQFALYVLDDLGLKHLSLFEYLLHRHPGNNDAGLALNNAYIEVSPSREPGKSSSGADL